jgi:hypothetical protein
MQARSRIQVYPIVLSGVLFLCSGAWFIGAFVWYVTNKQSKDGWSETPLTSMLALCLSPIMCIVFGFVLVQARRQSGDKFAFLDWCGIFAGGAAVALGAYLLLGALGSMDAMGI